jgi:hypothetical protein
MNPLMILPGPPKEGLELPFEMIREGWSSYKTKDDVLIKMRAIMLKMLLVDVDESGAPKFVGGTTLLFSLTIPPAKKGTPNPNPITQKQIEETIIEPDIPFETIREDWNEYTVEGASVSVKLVVTTISKSSLFDHNGDPVYNMRYQPVIKATAKPEVKQKFLQIKREKLPKPQSS